MGWGGNGDEEKRKGGAKVCPWTDSERDDIGQTCPSILSIGRSRAGKGQYKQTNRRCQMRTCEKAFLFARSGPTLFRPVAKGDIVLRSWCRHGEGRQMNESMDALNRTDTMTKSSLWLCGVGGKSTGHGSTFRVQAPFYYYYHPHHHHPHTEVLSLRGQIHCCCNRRSTLCFRP